MVYLESTGRGRPWSVRGVPHRRGRNTALVCCPCPQTARAVRTDGLIGRRLRQQLRHVRYAIKLRSAAVDCLSEMMLTAISETVTGRQRRTFGFGAALAQPPVRQWLGIADQRDLAVFR